MHLCKKLHPTGPREKNTKSQNNCSYHPNPAANETGNENRTALQESLKGLLLCKDPRVLQASYVVSSKIGACILHWYILSLASGLRKVIMPCPHISGAQNPEREVVDERDAVQQKAQVLQPSYLCVTSSFFDIHRPSNNRGRVR
ncbi:hypothetical protein PoB_007054200 [Plakobranchus ocellatus]|uniref:Uncharacterized protein n=1 Tax=Plakobranchus ocellatus TaxID=259542 RepID=A0AAV4DIE5_9GAST|nr:hypothetical protein PoB_007054200 [Plakobranchus ocellatus]